MINNLKNNNLLMYTPYLFIDIHISNTKAFIHVDLLKSYYHQDL